MESETLLSSTILLCQNWLSKLSESQQAGFFSEQLIYQVLDGKRDPLCFSDCPHVLDEAIASFTRNELAHASRKGPFQADKRCEGDLFELGRCRHFLQCFDLTVEDIIGLLITFLTFRLLPAPLI